MLDCPGAARSGGGEGEAGIAGCHPSCSSPLSSLQSFLSFPLPCPSLPSLFLAVYLPAMPVHKVLCRDLVLGLTGGAVPVCQTPFPLLIHHRLQVILARTPNSFLHMYT